MVVILVTNAGINGTMVKTGVGLKGQDNKKRP